MKHVSGTQIFARLLENDRQALIYSMNVEIEEELAMVLPIPVARGGAEDAVRFVDLSGYEKLFEDIQKAFPVPQAPIACGPMLAAQPHRPHQLMVHDVGAFVASFVPTVDAFARLDERFRLTPELFVKRAEYADYGFVVFQLKPKNGWLSKVKRQTIHPMAFTFPTRQPNALFYPTLHIHDGEIPERAAFDHTLYCQVEEGVLAATLPFQPSIAALGQHVDAARTGGLIDGARKAFRNRVMLEQPNVDCWFAPPVCAGTHVLTAEEARFSFRLSATAAYRRGPDASSDPQVVAARNQLNALHEGLLRGLRELVEQHGEAWGLVALRDAVETGWLSNDDVFGAGQQSPAPLSPGLELPIRITLSTRTDDVIEAQQIELGFGRVPTPARVVEIRTALSAIVRAAIG